MSNQPYPYDPQRQNYQPAQPPYGEQPPSEANTVRASDMGGAYAQSHHARYVDTAGKTRAAPIHATGLLPSPTLSLVFWK